MAIKVPLHWRKPKMDPFSFALALMVAHEPEMITGEFGKEPWSMIVKL